MAGKKPAPAKFEEEEEQDENWEEAVVDGDEKEPPADLRMRDWRDVERYREMKELKNLVDDDEGFEEIFQPPPRPRVVPPAKGAKSGAKPPVAAPGKAPAGKTVPAAKASPPAAPPAKPAAKTSAKPAAKLSPPHKAHAAPKTQKPAAKAAPKNKKKR